MMTIDASAFTPRPELVQLIGMLDAKPDDTPGIGAARRHLRKYLAEHDELFGSDASVSD
jgi:hypothetical protein